MKAEIPGNSAKDPGLAAEFTFDRPLLGLLTRSGKNPLGLFTARASLGKTAGNRYFQKKSASGTIRHSRSALRSLGTSGRLKFLLAALADLLIQVLRIRVSYYHALKNSISQPNCADLAALTIRGDSIQDRLISSAHRSVTVKIAPSVVHPPHDERR